MAGMPRYVVYGLYCTVACRYGFYPQLHTVNPTDLYGSFFLKLKGLKLPSIKMKVQSPIN